MPSIPNELLEDLTHGREETYLEYKGDVSWDDPTKKYDIVQTIFAMANRRDGGTIIIGVEDSGTIIGLTENNYNSFSHDEVNDFLGGKGNQSISCKVSKYEYEEGAEMKKVVFLQIAETKEFPLVYSGGQFLFRGDVAPYGDNIALRKSAIYIRNTGTIGNKEIERIDEWQELIERTYRKYEKETTRRGEVITGDTENPFDQELSV